MDGARHCLEVHPDHTLADVLTPDRGPCRDRTCGTCDVLVDGDPVRSCLMLAVQAEGARIDTAG